MKATGCQFDSATQARRRVTVGAQGAVALDGVVAALVLSEEGDDPRMGWLGQK
jgi:hypothetical protein